MKIRSGVVTKCRRSVLTSPHVNKIAQEQFQKSNFSCSAEFLGTSCSIFQQLFITKRLLKSSLPGIKLHVLLPSLSTKQGTALVGESGKLSSRNYVSLLELRGELLKNRALNDTKKPKHL